MFITKIYRSWIKFCVSLSIKIFIILINITSGRRGFYRSRCISRHSCSSTGLIRPLERLCIAQGTSRVNQRLREHFVFSNVRIAHRSARGPHGFRKVRARDFRDEILRIGIHVVHSAFGARRLQVYGLTDGHLGRALTNFRNIRTGETFRFPRQIRNIDIFRNRAFTEYGFEYGDPGFVVRERNVEELIETSRAHEGGIDDVRSVGGTDDKNAFFWTTYRPFRSKVD